MPPPPPSSPSSASPPPPLSPFSHPSTGQPVSFSRLMALRRHPTETDAFLSCTRPFSPMTYAFGGHVYAQAAWVASATVERGMVVHNISGHFILPGHLDVPFIYKVRRLRSGGIYSLRLVEVYQDPPPTESSPPPSISSPSPTPTPSFIATISFKRPESHPSIPSSSPLHPLPSLSPSPTPPLKYIPFSHQTLPPNYLRTTYPMLYTQPPSSHPYAPAADFDWFKAHSATTHPHPDATFPGVEMRKVDLTAWNAKAVSRHGVGAYRMLHVYRLIEPEESPLEEASASASALEMGDADDNENSTYHHLNLSLSAHLYASDRNGLFLIGRALGFGNGSFRITSLSHAVVFHADAAKLLMQSAPASPTANTRGGTEGPKKEKRGKRRKWFVQEAWSSVSGGNRAMHESRLFSFDPDLDAGVEGSDGDGDGDGGGGESGSGNGSEVLATTFQEGMCRLVSREMAEPLGAGTGLAEKEGEREGEKAKL